MIFIYHLTPSRLNMSMLFPYTTLFRSRHDAKVYGKAAVGAPPMSVPHLDTRYVGGQRSLMFGPYAGWSPKFLKSGRYTDRFASIKPSYLTQAMAVAPPNLDLLVYLRSQLVCTQPRRCHAPLAAMS